MSHSPTVRLENGSFDINPILLWNQIRKNIFLCHLMQHYWFRFGHFWSHRHQYLTFWNLNTDSRIPLSSVELFKGILGQWTVDKNGDCLWKDLSCIFNIYVLGFYDIFTADFETSLCHVQFWSFWARLTSNKPKLNGLYLTWITHLWNNFWFQIDLICEFEIIR